MSLKAFAVAALDDYQTTAAVAPSSRYLVQAMLEPLPLASARAVVELGAGTGVMTEALLALLPKEATLLAFEINPRFVRHLKKRFSDPRFELLAASAERAGAELRERGWTRVDAVISSLGLTFMSNRQRFAVYGGLAPYLDSKSVFSQFVYLHGLLAGVQVAQGRVERFEPEKFLRRYFRRVERRVVWRNLPPAVAFACRR